MIRVKNIWVCIRDIKTITYEENNGWRFLVITYMFNDAPVKIEVNDFDDFNETAMMIADVIDSRLA